MSRHSELLLVTGGAGFIGSAIVRAALADGWRVRVLDSLRADVHGPAASADLPPEAELVVGELSDRAVLAAALDGVAAVSHQAAKVGLGVDFSDAPDYVASNVLGTAQLLAELATRKLTRLVLASSMVVYGEGAYRDGSGAQVRPPARQQAALLAGRFDPVDADGTALIPALISEDDPLDPRNVYAATKLAQEHLVAAWCRGTGGTAAALRYHNVYGPGMPQNTPYAGVASLFRSALQRGEAPRVFEDGRQRRDFVHVRDVAAANLSALRWLPERPPGTFRPFNVGSGVVSTIGEVARALSRAASGPAPIVTGEYRLGDVRHITASSDRLRTELGWSPTMPFEQGMQEFATAPLRPSAS